MRTTNHTARGIPLAVLLLVLACASWAVMGEGALRIDQAIAPSEIYVAGGDAEREIATLVLTLKAIGPTDRYPIDCLFVIDASATSDIAQAREFAYDMIDQLGYDDRAGLISYGTTASLDLPLTSNHGAVKLAIADLTASGKSAMGLAMQLARREFEQTGRDEAVFVEILISDGQSSVGTEPDSEGEAAAQAGIKIVSVGLGTLINPNLLEAFAEQTDGLFFESPSDRARTDILTHLDVRVAATDVRVEKQLPAGLRLHDAIPSASQVDIHPDGSSTAIWRLSSLDLGEETSIEIEIEGTTGGERETDVSSTVTYFDFRGVRQIQEIPARMLTILVPNEPPIALFTVASELPLPVNHDVDFEDLSFDTDGDVVGWEWDFDDGTTSDAQNPIHRFDETGTYNVSLVAIDEDGDRSEPFEGGLTIEPNRAPVAFFEIETEPPLDTLGPIHFNDASTDDSEEVVAWEWDFGDGTMSREENPKHTYEYTGTFTVSLVVVDAEGARSKPYETEILIEIGPRVTAARTIRTCLPGDQTVADAIVYVDVEIEVSGALNGLSVVETIPDGWTFIEGENDGATARITNGSVEWLFVEKLVSDSVNAQRVINYSLQAPSSVSGTSQSSIQGWIGSSAPRFQQPILGEDKLSLTEFLSIPVVVSRWDTDADELRLCEAEPEIIDFAEIQYAVSLWLSGAPVPRTNDLTIDIAMMQDLIAYWLTGRSVHDSLP